MVLPFPTLAPLTQVPEQAVKIKVYQVVRITIGAAVFEKDVVVVPEDLALNLGHGGEPLVAPHVALRDGVITAAGPAHQEFVLAKPDPKRKIIKTQL